MMSSPPRKAARLDEAESDLLSRRARVTRSNYGRIDLKKCLFCQAEKKDRKNRRKLEELHRCTWDQTPITLVNVARIRKDERVLV